MQTIHALKVWKNTRKTPTQAVICQVNNQMPHMWLQKLSLRILKWLDASKIHYEEHEVVKSSTFNTKDVLDYIVRQHAELLNQDVSGDFEIVLGSSAWIELMSNHNQLLYKALTVEVELRRNHYDTGMEIIGIPVTLVPWLEGAVVVPRERTPIPTPTNTTQVHLHHPHEDIHLWRDVPPFN